MGFGINTTTPPAVKNIIIINCLFFLASIALPKFAGIDVVNLLGLHYFEAEAFNPIQLLTYMFLHDTSGLTHIFFNMFGLWMFGRGIEEALGTKRFLIFYFVTGVGAALVQEATWAISLNQISDAFNQYINTKDISLLTPYLQNLDSNTYIPVSQAMQLKALLLNKPVTIGASGCIFGLLIAFAMLFPKAEIFLLFIPIPIKAPIFVAIYAVAELFMGIAGTGDGVAHYAHLGGMLFGFILLLIWRNDDNGENFLQKTSEWFSNIRGKIRDAFSRTQMKVKRPQRNASDAEWNQYNREAKAKRNARIDEILEKIKRSGYSALTDDEKRDLFNMSK